MYLLIKKKVVVVVIVVVVATLAASASSEMPLYPSMGPPSSTSFIRSREYCRLPSLTTASSAVYPFPPASRAASRLTRATPMQVPSFGALPTLTFCSAALLAVTSAPATSTHGALTLTLATSLPKSLRAFPPCPCPPPARHLKTTSTRTTISNLTTFRTLTPAVIAFRLMIGLLL